MTQLLHQRLAYTSAFFTFALGLWSLWLFIRGRGLSSNFMGALVIGETVLVLEALLGAWRYFAAAQEPGRWVHLLYGVLAALLWPFLYSYSREAKGRVESAMMSAGSFFLWGIVMRAITTAAGPGIG